MTDSGYDFYFGGCESYKIILFCYKPEAQSPHESSDETDDERTQ